VLDLSKIKAGQLTLSLSDYSIRDVVNSVFAAVESLATLAASLPKRAAPSPSQAPAAAKAIDDFGHGRGDGVTDVIAGRRHAGRRPPAGSSPDSFKLVLQNAQVILHGRDIVGE
jgi:hypothetical protein